MHRDFWEVEKNVFGLHEFSDDAQMCGCGNVKCKAIGKHPRMGAWQNVPHWSEEQLDSFEESGAFASGYGVLCKGMIVVDVDARNGGVESYNRLCDVIPEIAAAGMITNTGSGGGSMHLFFNAPENMSLKSHHAEYKGIDFKSSGFVVGAGSKHKSGSDYQCVVGCPFDIEDAPKALLELLTVPEAHRAVYDGKSIDVPNSELESMLSYIDPDEDYDNWIQVGMAIHDTTCGVGFDLWDAWSKTGKKYQGSDDLDNRWHGFKERKEICVTIGTIIHLAERGGYKRSVVFVDDIDWGDAGVEKVPASKSTLDDLDDIDLLRPPALVGEITAWINKQSNYKREHLAVAAALQSVSISGGMRFYDAETNIYANLYSICIAGSGSGKNSILSAVKKLAAASGVQQSLHGGIKSEQEIYRNALRNQAVNYTIDEIGETLGKLARAKKSGGASYLEAIIGTLMSAYSATGDTMLINGDLREDVREIIIKELKAATKSLDNCEGDEKALAKVCERLKKQLVDINEGIKDPFFSVIGFTTPVSFHDIMDFDMATNGFMARSLVFEEKNDNPRFTHVKKEDRQVPWSITNQLSALYGDNDGDERVQCNGERKSIRTTLEARLALDKVRDEYFWKMAAEQSDKTGLTSIPRRGAEMTEKISLILAMSEGLRTLEHVRYAFKLSKRDVDTKLMIANANSAPSEQDALLSRIMACVPNENTETVTLGAIANKCRKYSKEDVRKSCEILTKAKRITMEDKKAKNGKLTTIISIA